MMSIEDVYRLDSLVSVRTAGVAVGLSMTAAYDSVKQGTFPVPVVQIGRVARIRRADLIEYLDPHGYFRPGHPGANPGAAEIEDREPVAS